MFFSRPAGQKTIARGDPSNYDWITANFTKDNTWRELDLSSIIPLGTKWVFMKMYVTGTTADDYAQFRKKGHTNYRAIISTRIQIGGVSIEKIEPVEVSTDRKLEYRVKSSITGCNILVYAWVL